MSKGIRKADFSPAKCWLLCLMQQINFGRILDLCVRDGEPDLAQGLRVVRTLKVGVTNSPRPELQNSDFELKAEVVDLFAQIEVMETGVVRCIEVRHGLPVLLEIEQQMTA